MGRIIKNYQQLATTPLRCDALSIAEAGLAAIDTKTVLEKALTLEGNLLHIQGTTFNLSTYRHIYIVGFGKVACTAAHTLETIFAGRVREGAVVGVAERVCQVVDTYAGTHPRPSHINYTASKHIEEVARRAGEEDLVLVIISGGGSALLCSSLEECDQGSKLFDAFLSSGGTIEELNTVRKHLSHLKGGGLAKSLYPATVIGLVFSDVPGGDMADVASGPTFRDATTAHDAQAIIDHYDLGTYTLTETPKENYYFDRVHNFLVASNLTALEAMQLCAKTRGYQTELVSATSYNTPHVTKQLLTKDTPTGSMRCIGGETVLSIPEDTDGTGGRNDYLALAMIDTLKEDQVFVALASDGHDNTEAAGAIVDHETKQKLSASKIDVASKLREFDSFPVIAATGDHLETGILESNVSDLCFLLTAKPASPTIPISDITVKTIKDSRGKDTIAVTVTAGTYRGTFSVPSGASTGSSEVAVLPPAQAATIVRTRILPVLRNISVTDQRAIDTALTTLGETPSLASIGGNVALGVSVAACKAAAESKGVATWEHVAELFGHQTQAAAPRLFVNLINGGEHASIGSNIQEHQIIPDTDDVYAALEVATQVQTELRHLLEKTYSKNKISIGDEGGFVIPSTTTEAPFQHLIDAIAAANLSTKVALGADMAASSFYQKDTYDLNSTTLSSEELLTTYHALHDQFPLLQHVEDPFVEHDFASFARFRQTLPHTTVIGDDLTTTNLERLRRAIATNAINGIIIKPNQIGTLSDTLDTMHLAYSHDIKCIVSHRSGETMDDFIADLARGTGSYGLKAGAPTMKERAVKYERLLAISQ